MNRTPWPCSLNVHKPFLFLILLFFYPRLLAAAEAGSGYLACLQAALGQTRSHLAELSQSAELAGRKFVAGGNLWVAGRQPDFIAEACGRAGGLMGIAPLGGQPPQKGDVVLYAVPGAFEAEDLRLLDHWREGGVTVIAFRSSAGLYLGHFPLDTVANVIELWTWTGEFVAACSRLGKMPVLYQSYGLPGGPERGRKYQGKRFHDDLSIQPVAAGVLGRQYLDQLSGMLARVESQNTKILQAAQWWRQAPASLILVTGHMFPAHAQDRRAFQFGRIMPVPAWEDKELIDTNQPPAFVLYLGYQFVPQKLLAQAKHFTVKLLYTDVQPAQPPQPADTIRYLDPAWPLADGCVRVPGYDVPMLPASGVVQAAIYWSLASERAKGGR